MPMESVQASLDPALDGPETADLDFHLRLPLLWGVVALVAGAVRLALIDRAPLSPSEVGFAWSAFQAVQGSSAASLVETGSPLLTHFTALMFWLFGASDVAARLFAALAGTSLALTPALLTRTLGWKSSVIAGVLIAICPIAVQLSRVADPSIASALIAMVVVASSLRFFSDRPWWAPWTLAAGIGLALSHDGGAVIALATAAVAALLTWSNDFRGLLSRAIGQISPPAERPATEDPQMPRTDALGPATFGIGIALIASTGALMDLRGVGFVLGDVWGNALGLLRPAPFPTRNLASLLAYAGPLLVLASWGAVVGMRRQERLVLFLSQWTLLLLLMAATFGQFTPLFAILPISPAALLAAMMLGRLNFGDSSRTISGATPGVLSVTFVGLGIVGLAVAQAVGATQPSMVATVAAIVGVVLLIPACWRQYVPATERSFALLLLGILSFAMFSAGSIGRLSFGGSPPGAELLTREETRSDLRDAIKDLTLLSRADSGRVLFIEDGTPLLVRWYGRGIRHVDAGSAPEVDVFTVRETTQRAGSSLTGRSAGTPFVTTSQLDRTELTPLAVARWVVSRAALVKGQPRDIVIAAR
ncbi:MAG: putative rane protein [Chloroflexi bacterium]|nr:putative rane protein [Chloroflexota bacterium]